MLIKKNLYFSKVKFFESHLTILSILIPEEDRLTKTELEVLATFMYFNTIKEYPQHICFESKKDVKKELKLSTSSMSTYLKTFRRKGYIKAIDNRYKEFEIPEYFIPEEENQKYMIKINNLTYAIK